jgi:myo-inositol-1(or 4)-monophosphatase
MTGGPLTSAELPAAFAGSRHAAELAFAIEVGGQAARLLAERYERVERVDFKSARDIVTEVDHLSEALVLDAIRSTFPDVAILAEESGEHRSVDGSPPTAARGRTWVIDPLDGTINYANGIPVYCVSIALVVDGRPVVGVIVDPSRDETFAATADGPSTLDREVVGASSKDRLADFVVSLSIGGPRAATRVRAMRKAIRAHRSMGSAALALAYVANGRFDAFVQQGGLSVWDIAAAGLVAERAGAVVSDMAGGPWFDVAGSPRSIGVLAAPAAHHPALLELAR